MSSAPISELTLLPVDTLSEEWRRECEARDVIQRYANKAQRVGYLERIQARRGVSARNKLEATIMELFVARTAAWVVEVRDSAQRTQERLHSLSKTLNGSIMRDVRARIEWLNQLSGDQGPSAEGRAPEVEPQ